MESPRAQSKPKATPPSRIQPPWIGKLLGHFKLLLLIGKGKMGRVIQAQDINLQRIVALKVLHKRIPGIDKRQQVHQFLREARGAAQIEHPNVVRIYEISEHEGWWYIAMEMLEGGNLREVVKAAGPLSAPRACALVADAAAALAVALAPRGLVDGVRTRGSFRTRLARCRDRCRRHPGGGLRGHRSVVLARGRGRRRSVGSQSSGVGVEPNRLGLPGGVSSPGSWTLTPPR